MKYFRNQRRSLGQRIAGVASVGAVLLCAGTVSADELQKSGEFQGNWTAIGTVHTLELGGTPWILMVTSS